MYKKFLKRLLDVVMSFFGIVVFAVPMLIIAIIIRCDSKGPAVFAQVRMGKNCKPFRFYKFRSMRIDAPKDCATRFLHSENYITKVGAFLRKSSLDELPQLFNIFKGNMSIIGPRPVVTTETDLIEARIRTGAYGVRPGLTGLAQINGRDILTDMQLKAEYDGMYSEHITLFGDIKIFFLTIAQVFKHEGIVEGTSVFQSAATEQFVQNDALLEEAVATGEEFQSEFLTPVVHVRESHELEKTEKLHTA